ncbi:hypothetical protein DS565_25615 [Salmonella enterica subsp. enterica serovar Bareilly]|nr:hypothetical protein [Salmonella enterica subsp. enterica serovar Bareilly]
MPSATGEKESGAFVPPQKPTKAYPHPVTCVLAGHTATEGASEGKQAEFPQTTRVSAVLFDFQRPDWHVCFPDFEGLSVSHRTREAAMDAASVMLLRRLAMAAQQGERIQKWRWITVPKTGILVIIYPESRRRVKVTRQTELI